MRRVHLVALAACFGLSGFSALLYETVWTRQLAALFGTSELATVTVLAAFMGGLAAGTALGEAALGRSWPVLRSYACLELGIAAAAWGVGPLLQAAGLLQKVWLGGQPEPVAAGGLTQSLVYLACGCLVLGPPTLAMGATWPLLVRATVRHERDIGPLVGGLYMANLVGAVLGTLTTAFWWLPALGLSGSLGIGVAANLLAGALAWLLPEPGEVLADEPCQVDGVLLLLVLLSGACALACEVLWTRLLAHLLGSSLTAFSVMLAACLLGLAVGSSAAARFTGRRESGWLGVAVTQLGAAAFFALAFWRAGQSEFQTLWGTDWASALGLACTLLLPPYLCLGATFTFAVRVLAARPGQAAHATGQVYRFNTAGAILGTGLAGFALGPLAGFRGAFLLLLGTQLLTTLVALWRSRSRLGLTLGAALLCGVGPLAAGAILRTSDVALLRLRPGESPTTGEVVYAALGPCSSVLATEDWGSIALRTNGLGEASLRLRGAPRAPWGQEWLGALPLALRAQARSVLVIGLGLGEVLNGLPPEVEVEVLEIEPRVLEAWQTLAPLMVVAAPPATRVIVNDARSALSLTSKRYDVIIAQASHPWTTGASHLYTLEFVGLVREHLRPGGVYVQWMGPNAVDEGRLRSLAATLLAGFPEVALFEPVPGLPLFVCSERVEGLVAARPSRYFAVREDLAAAWRLAPPDVRRWSQGAALVTDDRNLFAVGPRPESMGTEGLSRLVARLGAPSLPADLDQGYLAQRLVHLGYQEAGLERARRSGDPVTLARALWARGDQVGALEALGEARSESADFLRVRSRLWPVGSAVLPGMAGPVPGAARAAALRDWPGVKAQEAGLAAVPVTDVAYEAACQLRAGWRLELGQPREAVELLDRALAVSWDPYSLALRALAAGRGGDLAGQRESLRDLLGYLWWARGRRPITPGRLAEWVQASLPDHDAGGGVGLLKEMLRSGKVQ